MKISSILFWVMLALIAIFYLKVGNQMHQEKFEIVQKKIDSKIVENNITN